MALCGIDLAKAGHGLIHLSEIYAAAKTESKELRRAIETAYEAAISALAVSQHRSGDRLMRIRLEPMVLNAAIAPQPPLRSFARPRIVPSATPRQARATKRPVRKLEVSRRLG
jgi:hypothetical protein